MQIFMQKNMQKNVKIYTKKHLEKLAKTAQKRYLWGIKIVKMTITVIGDRNITTAQAVELKNYLTDNYGNTTHLISGGAKGSDTAAEQWATAGGLTTEIYLPDYQKNGKAATHIRNAQIVAAAKTANAAIIAYQPNGPTNGTQSTIKAARKAGVKVHEITPKAQTLF
jgi:hypothetical protein